LPAQCAELQGIAPLSTLKWSVIATPNDNDTDKRFELNLSSFEGMPAVDHLAQIDDQTHWYSHDSNEIYAYWFAFGHNMPTIPCDGTVFWYGMGRHKLRKTGSAEFRFLSTEWLQYPSEYVAWSNHTPTNLSDFKHWSGIEWYDNHTGYDLSGSWTQSPDYADVPLSGFMTVKAGDRPRIWLGSYVFLAGREGTSNTGWNKFHIWSYDLGDYMTQRDGVTYYFTPNP
jgi:hypothetical protein